MNDDQPHFRLNPGAYGRSLEPSTDPCDACRRSCAWKYTGSLYSTKDPTICARCIADGSVAKFLNNERFSFHDIEIDDAAPAVEIELLQRTPGVSCFNPFEWPVLDTKPLAFIGYGEDEIILTDRAAQDAIKAAFEELEWEYEPGTPTPYALVFREIDGNRYRAVIDLD